MPRTGCLVLPDACTTPCLQEAEAGREMHNTPLADYRLVVEPAAKAAAEAPKGSDPMAMAHQQQLDAIRAMQEQASQAAEQASRLPVHAVEPVIIMLGTVWTQLRACNQTMP